MKRLLTLQLVPGMIVAEDVYTMDRQLVLAKGTVLNDNYIMKLDLYGIFTVYVKDKIPDISMQAAAPKSPSNSERIKKDPAFKEFKREYDLNVSALKSIVSQVAARNLDLDVGVLLKNTLRLLGINRGNIGLLDILQNMREYDDSTFAHCINVALVCYILAGWLKWSPEEMELATACGLLHDIGKLEVPLDIISKPGKLSREEFGYIKKHPGAGYAILTEQKVNKHIANAALMHHERTDGSGYPKQLKDGQIDRYAKLVAIVDVYDAMTAARVYRGPICPFRVIEIFEQEGLLKYDVEFLLTFMENVVNTYIQNKCLLNDGRAGDIIYINKDNLSRPVVQCGTEYVNLAEHPELTIEQLL